MVVEGGKGGGRLQRRCWLLCEKAVDRSCKGGIAAADVGLTDRRFLPFRSPSWATGVCVVRREVDVGGCAGTMAGRTYGILYAICRGAACRLRKIGKCALPRVACLGNSAVSIQSILS